MKTKLIFILSIVILTGCGANKVPLASSRSILDTPIRTKLPQSVVTNSDAVEYYLKGTGYKLTTANPAPKESSKLLKQKAIYRGSSFVTSRDKAILRMFNYEVDLIIDKPNKLISFGFENGEVEND
jgi:hypothetical protein